jgi:hypothetical protein
MTATMADPSDSPEADAPDARTDTIVVIVVTVLAVVLLLARAPFALQQLWAEDGREFLGDAITSGPIRAFGDSEAGYYLFIPRVGGALASVVPLRAAAFAMWCWTALVTGWLVATVMVSGRTWLTTIPARVIVALGFVLLPILGAESIANIANIQFAMLFASLVVLISRPRSRLEWVNGCVVVAATGLTTPLLLTLLPFVAYRLLRDRRWIDPILISWAAGLVVQWLAIAVVRPDENRDGEGLRRIIDRFSDSALRENFSPFAIERYVGGILAVLIVVGLCLAAWAAWRQDDRERAGLMLGVPAFGFVFLVGIALYSGAPNRYMAFPALCLVWGILAGAESLAGLFPDSWRVTPTATAAIAALGLIIAWVPHWSPSDTRESGPTWSEAIDTAAEECRGESADTEIRVQIAPVREDRPMQWSVLVTCGDVV